MNRVYHLLTESEPFSEHHGGAISRWAANMLRDDPTGVIVAPSADGSWEFAPNRVRLARRLDVYKRLGREGRRWLPWTLHAAVLRRVFASCLHDLRAGDIVWVHNRPAYAAALAPLVAARGAKLVLHLHNSHLADAPARVARHVQADKYVFVSHFLRREALQRFPDLHDAVVLHNGAQEELFYPRSHTQVDAAIPTVLFASRLVPEKGLHVFLEAMTKLHRQDAAIRGIVVGGVGFGHDTTSEYLTEMKAKAPPNVQFEPYCSGAVLAEKFREAYIFCLPSCWDDPFPLAPLEAMASGVPVVATRSGGIPEMFVDGGGTLVERESADELATALWKLAADRELRLKMGAEAYANFRQRFTWRSVRERYREIVES
jgi:spore coat protein SA